MRESRAKPISVPRVRFLCRFWGSKMTPSAKFCLVLALTLVAGACRSGNGPATPNNTSSEAKTSTGAQDQWLGKWIGPEGTFLVLTKSDDGYGVMIQSLDGPNTYQGTASGDSIQFERNGKKESIHAGSGQDTGMKWLLDKKNCLVIKTGEGFCRD